MEFGIKQKKLKERNNMGNNLNNQENILKLAETENYEYFEILEENNIKQAEIKEK